MMSLRHARWSCRAGIVRRCASGQAGAGAAVVPKPATFAQHLDAYKRLIRYDKSIGTWLLLLPCYWGHALGHGTLLAAERGLVLGSDAVLAQAAVSGPLPLLPVDVLALFAAGAFVMRSAGCIINDIWDRDFDGKVERTKTRPIASGEVSVGRASGYLVANVAVGGAVLLSLHPSCVGIGILSLPCVFSYPLFKRFTHLPQLFLGLTFNWGVMVGYASVCHTVSWHVVGPMYAAGICWTMMYDTVYAHQDKEDDIKIGVKSSAILFGESKDVLHAFGAATTFLLIVSATSAGCLNAPVFFVGAVSSGAFLHRALSITDLNNPAHCGRFFLANKHYGLMICASLCLAIASNLVGWPRTAETEATEETKREVAWLGNVHTLQNADLVRGVLTGHIPVGEGLQRVAWW